MVTYKSELLEVTSLNFGVCKIIVYLFGGCKITFLLFSLLSCYIYVHTKILITFILTEKQHASGAGRNVLLISSWLKISFAYGTFELGKYYSHMSSLLSTPISKIFFWITILFIDEKSIIPFIFFSLSFHLQRFSTFFFLHPC